jgi:hypothetical protein
VFNVINSTHFRVNVMVGEAKNESPYVSVTKSLEFVFISSKRYYALTRFEDTDKWMWETVPYVHDPDTGRFGIPVGTPTSTTFEYYDDQELRSDPDDGGYVIAKTLGIGKGKAGKNNKRKFSFEFYTGLGSNGWSLSDEEYSCKKKLAHVVTWNGDSAVEINMHRAASHFFNDDPTRDMNAEMPTVGWCGSPRLVNYRDAPEKDCSSNYEMVLHTASARYNRLSSICTGPTARSYYRKCTGSKPNGIKKFNDWEQ